MYKLVNIKKGFPDSEYAIFLLEKEIEYSKKEGNRVLVFIHGYGSKGYGGEIKRKVEVKLKEMKNKKQIITFVSGDCWSQTNADVVEICNIAPELAISSQVAGINSGVTIVLTY